jgi:hypothetical protein
VHNEPGICPDNLFALRSNNSRSLSSEIELGKLPLKLLNANSRNWSLGRIGISPEKLLLERLIVMRPVHAFMLVGTLPVKWLDERFR